MAFLALIEIFRLLLTRTQFTFKNQNKAHVRYKNQNVVYHKEKKKVDLEDEDIIENVGPFWKNILESGMFFLYSGHNEKNGRYVILTLPIIGSQIFVHDVLKMGKSLIRARSFILLESGKKAIRPR